MESELQQLLDPAVLKSLHKTLNKRLKKKTNRLQDTTEVSVLFLPEKVSQEPHGIHFF